MPVIRVSPDYKPTTLDNKTKLKLVTEALVKAQGKAFAGTLILERTAENKLDQLDPREITSALNAIEKANEGLFVVLLDLSRWIEKDLKPSVRIERLKEHFGPNWQTMVDEDAIVLKLQDRFDNWCEAQRYKQSLTLANLSIEGREKVLATVTAIYARFELSSKPKVTISWSPSSSTEDYEARKLSLEFLTNKEAVREYDFQTDRRIEVEIDVKEFFRLRDELVSLYVPATANEERRAADHPRAISPNPFTTLDDLRWQDITIQFVNGHDVQVSARSVSATLSFKEMGLEDARTGLPNTQWSLMKVLADHKGQISWEDPEATDNIKKRKQLLADTLKTIFQIDDDPFFPYREGRTYRTKFTLIPEGD